MLIYRNQAESICTADKLAHIRSLISALTETPWDHARAAELLIECGELEAGIADALAPQKDDAHPTTRALRAASLLVGHAYYHSWQQTGNAPAWLARFARAFQDLVKRDLPERITINVPEGYAYYSLHPELYLAATESFFQDYSPKNAVVIGIRSIGTSLSGVVGAALEEQGCAVDAYTVRPRGHPFERSLALEAGLTEEWRASGDGFFIVVDEGPGLSGSSFICVTQTLAALGIPDERIVLFPSWLPAESNLVSATARAQWHRYRKYTASFEQVEIESGRLPLLPGEYVDLSAGQWRSRLYADEWLYPAVHPHHERRKYLVPANNSAISNGAMLFKFAGLGRYGRAKLTRAELLAEAGLAPRPHGLHSGFLAMDWVPGQPLAASNATPDSLDALARYLAFVQQQFPAAPSVGFDELVEMIRVNVTEGLPGKWHDKLGALDSYRSMVDNAGATALDARMLPNEWLVTAGQYIKTDGLDHHDDHFYPGCQNIAWDIAGTCAEFDLNPSQETHLLDQYRRLSGDRDIGERLPFYSVAYLSFRLGYAVMAADTLSASKECQRFQMLSRHYAKRLEKETERL